MSEFIHSTTRKFVMSNTNGMTETLKYIKRDPREDDSRDRGENQRGMITYSLIVEG